MKIYNMNLFFLSMSPWPLILSLSSLLFVMNLVEFLYMKFNLIILLNFFLLLLIMVCWWNDVIIESTLMGSHNIYVMLMTINSMIMFIISEIFFFISFFWTFFHSMFSPDVMIGCNWPMKGIMPINFLNLPLLNSLLLISSACSVTWSHYNILSNKLKNSKLSLMLTIIMGLMFLSCQFFEYMYSYFSFSDSIFGSIFFISTGFHGIHVIIGTLFLIFMFLRMNMIHFSKYHLLGFEFSIWYWHFVDIVWLYLYLMVYWLGS